MKVPGAGFLIWPQMQPEFLDVCDPMWDTVLLNIPMYEGFFDLIGTNTTVYGSAAIVDVGTPNWPKSGYFDGSGARLSVDNWQPTGFLQSDYTLEFFMKIYSFASPRNIFIDSNFLNGISTDNRLYMGLKQSGTYSFFFTPNNTLVTGAFHYIAIVYVHATKIFTIYVDGVVKHSLYFSGTWDNATGEMWIGALYDGSGAAVCNLQAIRFSTGTRYSTEFDVADVPLCGPSVIPPIPEPTATPHISTVTLAGSFIPYQHYRITITPLNGVTYTLGCLSVGETTTLAEYATSIAESVPYTVLNSYYRNLTIVTAEDEVVTVEALYDCTVAAKWVPYPSGIITQPQEAHAISAGSYAIYSIAPFLAGTLSSGWATGHTVSLKVRLLSSETWLINTTVSCSSAAGYDAILVPLLSDISGDIPSDLTFADAGGYISATQVDLGVAKYRIEAVCSRCPMSVGLTQQGSNAYPVAVPQISHFRYGELAGWDHNIQTGQTFTLTINGTDFTYTALAADTPHIVHTELVALINAGSEPVTAAIVDYGTDYCITSLTGDVVNVPFTVAFDTDLAGRATVDLVQEFSNT